MANLYVKAGSSNTSPYDTWAKAATSLATAVTAASTNDTIFVDSAFTENLAANPTYTPTTGVRIISTNDTATEPPTTFAAGAALTSNSTINITLVSGSWYGFSITVGASNTDADINLGTGDGSELLLEDCTLAMGTTNAGANVTIGAAGEANISVVTRRCTFVYANVGQGIVQRFCHWRDENSTHAATGTVPTTYFDSLVSGYVEIIGGNFSNIGTQLFGVVSGGQTKVSMIGCTLHASVTLLPTITQPGDIELVLIDCASGDTHYGFAHYDYYGSTTVSTSIYMDSASGDTAAAARYDGTNKYSWVVAGNANASFGHPYYSPWVDVYHAGTSAITPFFQTLREGSTTPYTDAEVWAEWMYKGTSGSSRMSFATDRKGPLATAAGQATGTGTDEWTGDSGPGSAVTMKLDTGSAITPAEIGTIRGRVCVAGNRTLYVNPKILGLARSEANVQRAIGTSFVNTNVSSSASGQRIIG